MLAAPIQITLTDDQQKAIDAFNNFLTDPTEQVFVLKGYSGCGKSTLVKVLLEQLEKINKAIRLVNPDHTEYAVALTATTNKAAENLSQMTGFPVSTIHSFLGLRVVKDPRNRHSTLSAKTATQQENCIIFIDEASYIDHQLLGFIFQLTTNCKIVFIGDPAQLTPVRHSGSSVFSGRYPGAELTEVVRQAQDNPIIDLSTKFRHAVNTGKFFKFKPDGNHVMYLPKQDFMDTIVAEFFRSNWKYSDSKILAWTNERVVSYNKFVNEHVTGTPNFQVNDYALCNRYMNFSGKAVKTDQMVQVTAIGDDMFRHGVEGNYMTINDEHTAFQPKSLTEKKAALKKATANCLFHEINEIENEWFDLRAVYASTVNKAQGSTFDRVFIDLNDIRKCNSGDQIARMLYVGVSRARHQVVLTGDIV